MSRPRIGLALGSGSARGWSHIGVLESLAEAGIEPDIVCGSSIGALVGAAYVAGRLAALKDWAEAVTWRGIVGLLDIRISGGGLIDGKRIVDFLRVLKIAGPIEGYPKAFAAIATDLVSGREVWLQKGPIDQAVRASIALPGLISPARLGDRWLLDGGLVNPVPVSACRALGADVVIAVNLNGELLGRRFESDSSEHIRQGTKRSPGEFLGRLLQQVPAGLRVQASLIAPKLLRRGPTTPGYFDVLANSINIMQDQITRTRLAGEPPHVMLLPRLRNVGLLEFDRAKDTIAEGRTAVEQALPALQRYL
ncbi:MAG: patatin-like phospholipase family protein [Kiloniellales bacterium]